jgi:predicted nucleic acid-binding protein
MATASPRRIGGSRLGHRPRAGAARLCERIAQVPDETLYKPYLFDVEVLHALRDLALTCLISEDRSRHALKAFSDVRVTRYPHGPLVPRIWELRDDLTAYDAAYVALAEALDAPLAKTDGRLTRAPGHRARVELYS